MLVGSIGYIISLGTTAWAFYTYGDASSRRPAASIVLASLLLFIASHAFGQGAVIWVFISEIFPNRVRARGQAWAARPLGHGRRDLLDVPDDRRAGPAATPSPSTPP